MKLFGLIGYPLGHSRSPEIWNHKFETEGIDARYNLYPLPSVSDIVPLTEGTPSLCGFNVTVPYKTEIIPYLYSLSQEASEAGAVNTVLIERDVDGSVIMHGFNTDITGFKKAVSPLVGSVPESMHTALVLGSGGASGAVSVGLRQLGWNPLRVSRHSGKGDLTYEELTPELIDRCGLVVNATPLGMFPDINSAPPFPFEYLHPGQVCYDLVYNPEITLFMRIARAHGCIVENGLNMLRFQAYDAWQIWK